MLVGIGLPLLALGAARLLAGAGDLQLVLGALGVSVGPAVFALAYFLADADEEGRAHVPASLALGMAAGSAAAVPWMWTGGGPAAWGAPVVAWIAAVGVRAWLGRSEQPARRWTGIGATAVGVLVGGAWTVGALLAAAQ